MRIWVPYDLIDVDEGLMGNSECRSKGQSVPDNNPTLDCLEKVFHPIFEGEPLFVELVYLPL
jgi:hypothetical protein